MLGSIVHRGPDDQGVLIDDQIAMGMQRLAIIDLDDGAQPIYSQSGRYAVIFNGEIYNYRELRSTLIADGFQFKTQSDTETIVHLFDRYGRDCVDHLRGMFAFAIWDHHERKLFIARDRLGIKPLYYAVVDNTLIFGSEIKSLLQFPSLHASLDLQSLSAYLSLKYVPAPRTLFAGVQSLPPGHWLHVDGDRMNIQRYWDVSFADDAESNLSESEATERLGELLRESVRLRLRSDVPFGAMLSGGIDSSLIVALMSEILDQPVNTFSVGFADGPDQDELPYAQAVADHFKCRHHTLRIGAKDFLEHATRVLFHLDQPIADQATVATHMVASLARQHVKMVLTGEGGDELFAGYARYGGQRYQPLVSWMPAWGKSMLRAGVRRMPGLRRAKIAVSALTIPEQAASFANWFPMFNDDAKPDVLGEAMADYRDGAADIFAEQLDRCASTCPLQRMLYVDTKLWLPDYLLLRGDKLTMANSLEARVPLLDHELVQFAASLPASMKLRGNTRKYLLKQVAAKVLPPQIIHRKKQGFPIPIDRWLRAEANEMMHDLLSPDLIARRGLFNGSQVQKLIAHHESGYADLSTELWGLMSLEMWMQTFVDHDGKLPEHPRDAEQSVTSTTRGGACGSQDAVLPT